MYRIATLCSKLASLTILFLVDTKLSMENDHNVEILTRFARIVAADGYSHGLQPVQWQALQFLARANRFSRTPKGLTAWLGQTKGSVSQTILALEAKGLVSRASDESDRRIVRVELSDAGRALLAEPPMTIAAQMLDRLPQPNRELFVASLKVMLREQLSASRQQLFGICRTCCHFSVQQTGSYRCTLLDLPLADHEANLICIEQEAA